jgi:DNA-binding transcriptional MerR regulator
MEFVNSKGAMVILGIKSKTTLTAYENKGLKVYRPFSNRKRYKVSDLEKIQLKG